MAHIFISYSKHDIEFARYLRAQLQSEGFAVWMDEVMLVPSERWWRTIEQNITTCSAFIVIMSPSAYASDWVEREILIAEEQKKPIFPILLEGKRWSRLANIQYLDMTAGARPNLPLEFVEGLQQFAERFTGQPAPPPLPPAAYNAPAQPSGRSASSALTMGMIAVLAVVVLALLLDRLTQREPSTTPLTTVSESQTSDAAALQPSNTSIPPTPAPTDTLEPSVTPQPSATMQPTLLPTDTAVPSPTLTPIPPTPTPTVVVAASPTPRIFSSLRVSEQLFERGRMYYFRDTGNIWIVTYSGTDRGIWSSTSNPFRDGDPVSDASLIAPSGRYQPIYGFGKLWRESGWRDRLGWGVTEEIYYNARYEEHPGGTVDANGQHTSAPGYYLLESRSGSLMRFSRIDSSWQVLSN